jgi:hypothetical protein
MTIQLSDTTRICADELAIHYWQLEIIAEACNIETIGIELYPDEDAREQQAAVVDEQGDIIFAFASYPVAHNHLRGKHNPGFEAAYGKWCSQQDPVVIPF